jgi:hypothetical protein
MALSTVQTGLRSISRFSGVQRLILHVGAMGICAVGNVLAVYSILIGKDFAGSNTCS